MTDDTPTSTRSQHPKDHVAAASTYTGTTYMVLYLIAETIQAKHNFEFWGSIDRLAARGHMNRDTARKAFRTLEDDGWIECVQRSTGRKPTRYRFLFQPADLEGVGGEANPRISSSQPADLDGQPADLEASTRGSRPPTRGSGGTNQENQVGNQQNRTRGVAVATIGAVTCTPDLATFARRIITEECPTQPMPERRDRSITAADKWLRALTTAGDPQAALRDVEPILRWALHHRWWAQKATSITAIADNWPAIVAQHAAETQTTTGPKLTHAQEANLADVHRFLEGRRTTDQRKELA